MRRRAALLVTLAAACGGEPTKPPAPQATTIEIVASAPASSVAGTVVAPAPTFLVKDQNGAPMAGVPFTVAASHGGSVQGAPAATVATGATPVGTWSLAPTAGSNTLTITVQGISPYMVTVQGTPGVAAKLVAQTPETGNGTVGQASPLLPRVRVTDINDNSVAGTVVQVAVAGGGSSATTIIVDAQGIATVASWTLGTMVGQNTLTLTAGAASKVFTVSAAAGPATTLAVVSGNAQSVQAGRALAQPVVFSAADQYGNPVSGSAVSVTVVDGEGSITTPVTDAQGRTSVTWTLGRSAVPQALRATAGTFTTTATATVQTAYNVEVRFYGPVMAATHRTAFTNAAARVNAMITGDLQNVTTGGSLNLAVCGDSTLPTVNEIVDDLVIYAKARPIDGAGGLLARAGPCLVRDDATELPVYGVMEFDSDDLDRMALDGTLESVILHEMLHVVGIGSYWQYRGLLTGVDSAHVAFTGPGARDACRQEGGTTICGSSVPVEATGGAGTAKSHWRESVFDTELMTGWENAVRVNGKALPLPLSRMTIGSLLDLGYVVNPSAADLYRIPGTSLLRGERIAPSGLEEELLLPRARIGRTGHLTPFSPR